MSKIRKLEISWTILWPPLSQLMQGYLALCLISTLVFTASLGFGDYYHKIPKRSPGAYIFQRPFLRGLFLEGLIFGGAYLRRVFALRVLGGLYLEGVTYGGAYFRSFTVPS